jgi:hypothetical protein
MEFASGDSTMSGVISFERMGNMCRRVKCSKCGLATWAGCGQHVNQVMAGIPQSQRCTCVDTGFDVKVKKALSEGWLERIFGS